MWHTYRQSPGEEITSPPCPSASVFGIAIEDASSIMFGADANLHVEHARHEYSNVTTDNIAMMSMRHFSRIKGALASRASGLTRMTNANSPMRHCTPAAFAPRPLFDPELNESIVETLT